MILDPSIPVVDAATIMGGAAALLGVAIAWFIYANGEGRERKNVQTALRGICTGLREELDFAGEWAATAGTGYPLKQPMLNEWLSPHRLVWRFNYQLSKNLALSPYAIYLDKLIQPISRFVFSCDRFFFLIRELRQFALSQPELFARSLNHNTPRTSDELQTFTPAEQEYFLAIQKMNHHIHTKVIGGEGNSDPNCLYRTHKVAIAALDSYIAALSIEPRPKFFRVADMMALLALIAGIGLLVAWFLVMVAL